MNSSIAIVGSYNVGLVVHADRVPVWGETLLGSGFSEGPGGKGSNQAVAVSRLGGQSIFISCIGEDHYGMDALHMLEAEKVNITHVKRTNKCRTGVGLIIVNSDGNNCIIVDPGANNLLLEEDIDRAEKVFNQVDIVLFQLEINFSTSEYALKMAKNKGKTVILNPAPAIGNVDFLLKYATIITPNESELKILCGMDTATIANEEEYVIMARSLIKKGPATVIVTLGEDGALLITENKVIKKLPPKVMTIDTTGAGDSFTAAFAVALSNGASMEDAVQYACYAGAYTVRGLEVVPALPTQDQLNDFIRSFTD